MTVKDTPVLFGRGILLVTSKCSSHSCREDADIISLQPRGCWDLTPAKRMHDIICVQHSALKHLPRHPHISRYTFLSSQGNFKPNLPHGFARGHLLIVCYDRSSCKETTGALANFRLQRMVTSSFSVAERKHITSGNNNSK